MSMSVFSRSQGLRLIRATFEFVIVLVALIYTACGATAEPLEIVVDGQKRSALVELSAAAEPQPTIIMMHESGGQAAVIAKNSGLPPLAHKLGFVAVFPENVWNFLPSDLKFPDGRQRADDAGFLNALIAELVRRRITDPNRVYLSGVSLGGLMALRMVCLEPGPFAGVALFTAAMPDVVGDRCRPSKPVPFLLMQGTADQFIPYEGGALRGGLSVWSADRLVAFFRQHNGCPDAGTKSVRFKQPHRIEIEHASNCSGATVVNYRVVGGGHSVPWTEVGSLLWRFFIGKFAP